jgi:hypothetical protein
MQLGCSRPVQAGLAREVELVITSAQRRITPMAMQAGGAACLLLLSLAAFAPLPTRARPDADEIHALPGWDGALPSRMWSGYVSAGTAEEAGVFHALFGHYFFVESERSPTTDPLVVWTNGGPGAASFFGEAPLWALLLLGARADALAQTARDEGVCWAGAEGECALLTYGDGLNVHAHHRAVR